MRKIVIDQNIPFLKDLLEPWFEVVYAEQIEPSLVRDAEAMLIRTRTRCDEAMLAGSAVRFIGTATIGFDHIDMEYCRRHGIEVATAAGCNARGVMEYIASALVHLSRRRGWSPGAMTLGVVGVGHVGSLVAELGCMAGFRVICCDPPRMRAEPSLEYVSLETLLPQSDLVTFHVPLNKTGEDRTLGMVDAGVLSRMKPGATLINTSRGEVIDEVALKEALRSGQLGDVVLDVWGHEPEIDPELAERVTYGTTHIAGYSIQGKANGSSMVVQALAARYGLPLKGWYPEGVARQVSDRPVDWPMLQRTIDDYYNITADDKRLRGHVERFEELRNHYVYREEYF